MDLSCLQRKSARISSIPLEHPKKLLLCWLHARDQDWLKYAGIQRDLPINLALPGTMGGYSFSTAP